MTPTHTRNRHDPDAGQYGDCMRAAIATVMELPIEDVPHFAADNPDGVTFTRRIRDFLRPHGLTLFIVGYDPASSRDEVLRCVARDNPHATYLLSGSTGPDGGDHVVVCQHDAVAHDPNWYPMPLIGPNSGGAWFVMVLSRL